MRFVRSRTRATLLAAVCFVVLAMPGVSQASSSSARVRVTPPARRVIRSTGTDDPSSTTVASSANPVQAGQQVTYTATVSTLSNPSPLQVGPNSPGTGFSATGTDNSDPGFGIANACNGFPGESDSDPPNPSCGGAGTNSNIFYYSGTEPRCTQNAPGTRDQGSTFTWAVTIPKTGNYTIEYYLPWWSAYDTAAHYGWNYSGGSSGGVINQDAVFLNGNNWFGFDIRPFTAGQTYEVVLYDDTAPSDPYCHYNIADDVRWVWQSPTLPNPTGTVSFNNGPTPIPGCAAVSLNATTGQAQCTTTFVSPGTFPITADYSGDGNYGSSASSSLNQVVQCPGFAITTPSPLPPASFGQVYSTVLTACGGNPPYTWSVVSGKLPRGLHLSKSTGIILGRPRQTDRPTYTFTVKVVDKRIKTKHHRPTRNITTKDFLIAIS